MAREVPGMHVGRGLGPGSSVQVPRKSFSASILPFRNKEHEARAGCSVTSRERTHTLCLPRFPLVPASPWQPPTDLPGMCGGFFQPRGFVTAVYSSWKPLFSSSVHE